MNRLSILLSAVLLVPLPLLAQDSEEPVDNERPPVREMTLEEVPAAAVEAAREAEPDVYFNAAERLIWRDEPVFRIIGAKGNTIWSVYANVQGEILHVERDARD